MNDLLRATAGVGAVSVTGDLVEQLPQVVPAADGATVSEVARRVHLSEGTTRNHLSQAMAKTGAPTRAAAVHIAAQKGWIIE